MIDDDEIAHSVQLRFLNSDAAIVGILEHGGRDGVDRAIAGDDADIEVGRPQRQGHTVLARTKLAPGRTVHPADAGHITKLVDGGAALIGRAEHDDAAKFGYFIASEILPNIIQSVFVLGTLRMGYMIIMEASLSFLGLGIQPPTPAWGSMVAAGRDYLLNHWWVATLPGFAILIMVLSINLFGEGLRDILDPRLQIE